MKKTILGLSLIIAQLMILHRRVSAQYVIKEADVKYELLDYRKAIDLYERAYKKKATLHAAERLAECNASIEDYKQAESWYAIAVNMPGADVTDHLNYAKALQNNAKYSEAKTEYRKYAELDKTVSSAQADLWSHSCDSAMIWMKNPKQYTIRNEKKIISSQSDWGAVAYGNGIVFTSDRANSSIAGIQKGGGPFLKFDGAKTPDRKVYGWTGNGYLRLYFYDKVTDSITLFPLKSGTDYHVGAASFSADGNEMYFTLTRIPKNLTYTAGKLATINVEIYSSLKDASGVWSVPLAFKYNKANTYSVGDPYLTKDGRKLYFVSDMPGGKGGMDIYYSEKNTSGEWGVPVNLVDINTAGNERSPSFDDEGNFYFSSDGRIGMGGLDIYKAVITGDHFSNPVNMGYPVNSPQDDFAYNFSSSNTGYFSSNRSDGLGSDDIYSLTVQKILAFRLAGIVYNKITNEPLANAIVSLNKTGGGLLKVQTDNDGQFNFNLESASAYNLTADKTNFRSDAAEVSTVNLTSSTVIKQNLYLEQITLNKEIVLKNIYYDFDKSNIRPDAAIELDKLVEILKDNPTIWIELGSHTDSRGNDQYNQWLSQKRANSAVQYIIDRGISKNRITAKGYGESQLLNGCANGIPCIETEHQTNRRTEFKIVKY